MKRPRSSWDILGFLVILYNTVLGYVPAAFFLVTGVFCTYLALSSPNWPSTTGEVYALIDRESHTDVLYAYEAMGMQRDDDCISFSLFPLGPEATSVYAEGQEVQVYYHPSFPSHSVLVPGWGWSPVAHVVLGLVFIPIGWVFSRWAKGTVQW
jgi:hypothetical protein